MGTFYPKAADSALVRKPQVSFFSLGDLEFEGRILPRVFRRRCGRAPKQCPAGKSLWRRSSRWGCLCGPPLGYPFCGCCLFSNATMGGFATRSPPALSRLKWAGAGRSGCIRFTAGITMYGRAVISPSLVCQGLREAGLPTNTSGGCFYWTVKETVAVALSLPLIAVKVTL